MPSSDDIVTILLISGLTFFVVFAILYAWIAWALSHVFVKLGEKGWRAWVPVLNLIVLFRLGGQNPLWLLAFVVPGLNIVGLVFEILAIHRINARFGKGVGFTVFGALVFPVWATVLGFGHERPVAEQSPFAEQLEEPPVAPPAPAVPAPSTASVVSPAPFETPEDAFITVPPPAPVADSIPVAEPGSPEEVALRPSRRVEAPTVEEATVVVQRRARSWHLTTDAGQIVALSGPIVLLGRNPAASADTPGAQLVSLDDPDKSVSKTHARLELVDGGWVVTDLHSTNGVTLLADADAVDGTEIDPDTAAPAGEFLLFGELRSRIHLSS